MIDRIDKFLASLSEEQLAECRDRIDRLLRRRRGRPRGRSNTAYHKACRLVASAALRAKQEWLDDHPERKRVPSKFVTEIIEAEIAKHRALDGNEIEAFDAIQRHIDMRIREFLPRSLRSGN
jgi:hypothetical protein